MPGVSSNCRQFVHPRHQVSRRTVETGVEGEKTENQVGVDQGIPLLDSEAETLVLSDSEVSTEDEESVADRTKLVIKSRDLCFQM